MTIRRLTILFIAAALISGNLFSQKIFREGYIIKNTGEVFSGLVGYNPDSKIPKSCTFKRFDIAVEITYNPKQVVAFGYKNGNRFESLEIEGEKSFYETLVTGEITVYKKGSRYYLKKGDLPPAEVKDGKNYWLVDGKGKEFVKLSDLLKYLTSGSKIEIRDDLALKNDLVPVAVAYNKVTGNAWFEYNQVYSEKDITISAWRSGANRIRFSVLGGINTYTLKLNPKMKVYIPNPEKETGLIVGLTLEKVVSKKSDNLGLKAEIQFLEQTFYSYSKIVGDLGYIYRDDAFFNFSAFKIPLLIQYSFTGKKIVPYINGGLSGMIFLNKDYIHIREIENSLHNISTYEDHDMVFNFGEVAAMVSAGMKIRIVNNFLLNIEGRFEFGSGAFNKSHPVEQSYFQHSMQTSLLIGVSF